MNVSMLKSHNKEVSRYVCSCAVVSVKVAGLEFRVCKVYGLGFRALFHKEWAGTEPKGREHVLMGTR